MVLLLPGTARCQVVDPINTDRPDQSDGTYILPPKNLQLETGINIFQSSGLFTDIMQSTMLRYGSGKKSEVRLLINEGFSKEGNLSERKFVFYPAAISTKYALYKERKIWPAVTAVAYIKLPIASKKYQLNRFAPSFLLAFQNDFSDKLGLGYNFGITRNGTDDINYYLTTASFSAVLSEKFSLFIEYFSQFNTTGGPSHNMDTGLQFLINPRLQLDMAAGSSLFDNGETAFETFGVSYRFESKK